MSLRSLFPDKWFSPRADDFTLATQFVVAGSSQSFFQEKISSRWAYTFIWQFNLILLLCLRNLSSLMKKFLWVDALLWYFISIWHHCCFFTISLSRKKILMSVCFFFGNLIRYCCCGFAVQSLFLSNVDLQMWKCQRVCQEASFVEKVLGFQLHGDTQLGLKGPVAILGSCSGAFSIEKAKPM